MFALLAVVDGIIQRTVIFPSFLKLEQQEAGENIRRIFGALDREIFHLDQLCHDWATWNDTYEFIDALSEKYVEDNLIEDAFMANRVNLIAYFSNDGWVVWGEIYDLEAESRLSLPFLEDRKLDVSNPMLALQPDPSGGLSHVRSGVLMTDYGPLIFVSRSILRSDGTGPQKGILTMGRLLTDKVLTSLRDKILVDFQVAYPLSPEAIKREKEIRHTYQEADLTYYARKNDQQILVWAVYADAMGAPAFSVTYRFPREITQKGLTSIRYALALVFGTAMVVLVILIVLLQTVVVKPLKKLTDHASRMDREGDYSIRIDLNRRDEIGRLAKTLEMMMSTIAERTEALKTANEKLKQISIRDGLTGIANRRLFDEFLEREWRRMSRMKSHLSLILADVDYFKRYNDMYGHQQGDNCLVAVASAIAAQVRRPADLAARYGGEEFAIILPDTDIEGASHVAEQIRRAVVDMRIAHEGCKTAEFITLSLGVNTIVPGPEDDMRTFVDEADQALYQAKRAGRNQSSLSSRQS